jgi:hypothetical protein
MTTGTILFTIGHFALFIFTRVKYVRKFKRASQEKAHFEVENIQLKSKLETLEQIINAYE